jgi:hypothetical protein
LPDPAFVAASGDLYKLAGHEREAAAQYALVEQIGHLSAASGALYNRQLALFMQTMTSSRKKPMRTQ